MNMEHSKAFADDASLGWLIILYQSLQTFLRITLDSTVFPCEDSSF